MKGKIKSQKGFAASDALIAVMIIALFTGLISNILYNIYIANSSVKRMSKATGYIVDMFEYIDKNYYDDVTIDNLTNYFNNKYYFEEDGITVKSDAEVKIISEGEESDTPFNAELILTNYNQIEGNEDKFDLVKEVTMKVNYQLGNKNQTIEMKRVKQRENLEIPNKPNLSLFELQTGENIYPIKNIGEEWVVCNQEDNKWYNYENGNWAIVLKTGKDLVIDEIIDINNLDADEAIYGWIPRYAYDSNNNEVKFLFRNTDKTVILEENQEEKEYSKLVEIDQNIYTVQQDFKTDSEELEGIWTNDTTTDLYANLNRVYPLEL